jgi:basic membrane protein A
MKLISRRNVLKSAAAVGTLPLLGKSAFAMDPIKVAFVYLGPIGDHG